MLDKELKNISDLELKTLDNLNFKDFISIIDRLKDLYWETKDKFVAIRLMYIIWLLLIEWDEQQDVLDHYSYGLLLTDIFIDSKDIYSDDWEYLFFIGYIIFIDPYPFEYSKENISTNIEKKILENILIIDFNNIGDEMKEKSYKINPENPIIKFYMSSNLSEKEKDKLVNKDVKKYFQDKGYWGDYFIRCLGL